MIKNLRKEIDSIDKEILKLIQQRFKLMPKIANYKFSNNLKIFDSVREKQIIESKYCSNKHNFLNKPFLSNFFKLLFSESKKIQREEIKKLKK